MVIKEGYKQTEIGVIPKDWEVKTISEFTTPVRGGSPRPAGDPKYFNGNFIPWLTVASLTNIPISQIYVSETDNYLTEAGSFHSRILEKETLIIANSGATLGVAKLLSIKCCANDGIAALLDFDTNISKFYVVYFINTKIKYLREVVATGNGQPNLNTDLIGKIQIPLPPNLAEQTAIATALSDADGLITGLEKLIAKKRNIKQGAMQQLLKPKEGWEVKKLADVCDFYNGKGHEQSISENGNYIVVNSKFVSTQGEVYKCSTENLFPLEKNDITIVMSDIPNGKALAKCFIIPEDNRYTLNQRIGAIRTNIVDYKFLYFILNRNDYYLAFDSGTGQTNLKKNDILDCPVNLPSTKEEQTKIATILSDMDAELSALEQKLEKYKKVKLGMMQELLTGKTRLV